MSSTVLLIGGSALVTALIKAVGPVALGGRDLPLAFSRVIALMAPALLAALRSLPETVRLTTLSPRP
jgi:hypothetical protein